MSLTSTEKIALFVVGAIAILALGIFFVIKPAFTNKATDDLALSDSANKVTQAKLDIAKAANIDASVKTAFGKAKDSAKTLLPSTIDKPSLHLWFCGMADQNKLKIMVLQMSDPIIANVGDINNNTTTTEAPVKSILNFAMKNYADQYNGKTVKLATKDSSNSSQKTGDLMMTTVVMTMTGTYADMHNFFDTVNSQGKTVEIAAFNCGLIDTTFTCSVKFNCYYTQKLDSSDDFAWNQPKPAGKGSLM